MLGALPPRHPRQSSLDMLTVVVGRSGPELLTAATRRSVLVLLWPPGEAAQPVRRREEHSQPALATGRSEPCLLVAATRRSVLVLLWPSGEAVQPARRREEHPQPALATGRSEPGLLVVKGAAMAFSDRSAHPLPYV